MKAFESVGWGFKSLQGHLLFLEGLLSIKEFRKHLLGTAEQVNSRQGHSPYFFDHFTCLKGSVSAGLTVSSHPEGAQSG